MNMQTQFTIEQTDAQLIDTKADITYDISFERATRHCISIRMSIRNNIGQQVIIKYAT